MFSNKLIDTNHGHVLVVGYGPDKGLLVSGIQTLSKQLCDYGGFEVWVRRYHLPHWSGAPSLFHPSHWSGSGGKTLRRSVETLFCHFQSGQETRWPVWTMAERANTSLLQPWQKTTLRPMANGKSSRWCGQVGCWLPGRAPRRALYRSSGMGKPCLSPLVRRCYRGCRCCWRLDPGEARPERWCKSAPSVKFRTWKASCRCRTPGWRCATRQTRGSARACASSRARWQPRASASGLRWLVWRKGLSVSPMRQLRTRRRCLSDGTSPWLLAKTSSWQFFCSWEDWDETGSLESHYLKKMTTKFNKQSSRDL